MKNESEQPNLAALDQAGALLGDTLPPLWRRLYLGCVGEGFTEQQAMSLVETYIIAMTGIGG